MSDENLADGQQPQNPGAQTIAPESSPDDASLPAGSLTVPSTRAGPYGGISLGELLTKQKRHPVLLFGTLASGKSLILMSMIASLRNNPGIDITLGEPIYPPGHPRHEATRAFASAFFDRQMDDFERGRVLPKTTEIAFPLFIPIDIRPSRDAEPVKFAFLEGRGDWYLPTRGSEGPLYQDFKDEIVDVLTFYNDGLSAIFVAPCTTGDDFHSLRDNDLGLIGALNSYRLHRKRKDQDALLYLLTKWDTVADPVENRQFGVLQPSDVSKVLREQYSGSWTRFQQLPRSLLNDSRFFMQYCAGYLVKNANRPPPPDRKTIFDRYPRTLLNWLYGNATRKLDDGEEFQRVLFADVMAPDRVRFWKRVTDFVLVR